MYVVKQEVDRYEVVETLAEGAMGTVQLARDRLLGRLVAIKTARLDGVADVREQQRLREALLQEAKTAELLSHPNIVDIYEVLDEAEGESPSLVLEYVPGTTLAELLKGESPLPLDLALAVLSQIASALDHAHTMGIVHGDIKAANILVGEDEQTVKLADFGIARESNLETADDNRLYGTPRYVAPELLMGQRADARSDLYSLGVLLFEVLTGRSPFHGTTAADVTQEIVQGSLDLSESALPDIPEALREVLHRLLQRSPDARYQSAQELLADLGYSSQEDNAVDETVATKDLTELVVPELPEIGETFEDRAVEPESELIAKSQASKTTEPKQSLHRASADSTPWIRYAVIGLVTTVLALAVSWIALWVVKPSGQDTFAGSEAHERRVEYVPLLKEGHRLLRAGEPAVAARIFRRAEEIAPNVVAISRHRKAAEQEALAIQEHLVIQGEVQDLIDRSRRALSARETSRAFQLATVALTRDPENLEASALLRASKSSKQAVRPAPQRVEPVVVAEAPEPMEPQATVEFPSSRPSARPRVEQRYEPSPIDTTPAGMSNLQVDVFSYLPKGVVTIYSDEDQILLQPFRFVRKAGLVRRKKSAGRLEKTMVLPAGTSEFRIYVSAEGFETQTVNLTATLDGGGSHVLRLIIAENGTTSAQLN